MKSSPVVDTELDVALSLSISRITSYNWKDCARNIFSRKGEKEVGTSEDLARQKKRGALPLARHPGHGGTGDPEDLLGAVQTVPLK